MFYLCNLTLECSQLFFLLCHVCMPFMMLIFGSYPFIESWLLIKYAIHPLIVCLLILIAMMPLCLGDILRVDDNSYCCLLFTVLSISEKCAILLYVAVLFLIPGIWQEKFFWISIPNSISVYGSLSHIMKLWVNFKSGILRWSAVIPNAIIGDPSAVFILVVLACIGVLKLLLIVWYVEYLMSDMAVPESIRT